MLRDSFELLLILKRLGYDRAERDEWWWPASGTFQTVVGAILTQNTRWERVEISLENLEKLELLSLHAMANADGRLLEEAIRPSGFYRNKARVLRELAQKMLGEFSTFENFAQTVDREWLLQRRGIGPESADAILNYACYKEAFVVDSYTARLLGALAFTMEGYDEIAQWFVEGIYERYEELFPSLCRAQCYARSHGMIVEYCKAKRRGSRISVGEILRAAESLEG